jgi:hypothetical protein
MEPSAMMFNNRVKFFNFTHYNTDDLVRVMEAPLRARLAAGCIDTSEVDYPVSSIHLSYGGTRGAKVKLIGGTYRNNGIRIRRPNHLHDNPMESLSDTSREVPMPVVQELLQVAARLFAPSPAWDPVQRRRKNDVDMRAIAAVTTVRIEDAPKMKLPKGYMSREHAHDMAFRRSAQMRRKAGLILRSARHMESTAANTVKYLKALPDGPAIPSDLTARVRVIEQEASELYQIFTAMVNDIRNMNKED